MSKNPIRTDKTCLNCSHVVEKRYCPNCGQENTETRKTFHHLFIHFFEDLTHYENAFWKTIGNLLFRPGSLTKVYLSGKRMSYLAPIRLYIFISFVTFFLLSLLPNEQDNDNVNFTKPKKGVNYSWQTPSSKKEQDSVNKALQDTVVKYSGKKADYDMFGYSSARELDSIQQHGKEDDKLPNFLYKNLRKAFYIKENNSREEIKEKFWESLWHNYPKALFIYMPIFAFVLWLFQDKKRWYYFDHGIFTLHYFSFLLLIYLIAGLISCAFGLVDFWLFDVLDGLIAFVLLCYAFYYFFPAHHRFYQETRGVTIVKGGCMFFINMFLAGILMLALMIYTFLNIH